MRVLKTSMTQMRVQKSLMRTFLMMRRKRTMRRAGRGGTMRTTKNDLHLASFL